jgi:ABC-type antimicrobial peptide transport system permease subunit
MSFIALPARGDRKRRAYVTGVTAGFQEATGLALAHGRWLTPAEVRASEAVVVIDERGARALFGGEAAVDRVVSLATYERPSDLYRVVGVVQDANVPAGLPSTQFFAYLPLSRVASSQVIVIARGAGSPDQLFRALRGAVARTSPDLAVYDVMSLRDAMGLGRAFLRLFATALSAIGAVGVAIAFIGLYGVIASCVEQRRRELAVRAALGATTSAICRMLAAEGLRLIGSGIVIGMGSGIVVSVLLRRRFWELPALDWATLTFVPASLISLGLVASVLPLRGFSRRHLVPTLRAE